MFTESALESAYDNGLFKDRDLGKQEGIKEGIKEGIELGELQERQKSIVKLASVGITHDTIAAAFGISVDEVRAILEQRH